MEDYIIKRNKVKLFWLWLVVIVLSVICLLGALVFLVDGDRDKVEQWFPLVYFTLMTMAGIVASVVLGGQLFIGSSEFLKITPEGFAYSGYGLGGKVYVASWREVDRIFRTKRVVSRRHGAESYRQFISVVFEQPEDWEKQVSMNQSKSQLTCSLMKFNKRKLKNGVLDIPLDYFTDHSDKQIHDVIDLMNQYHQQALIKEKKP